MVPFSLLARYGCTSHASLALALSAEFGPVWSERADEALDELAAWLAGARADAPEDQLRAAAMDDLVLDRVAVGPAGHPPLPATVEAARRAGLALGVVAGIDGAFVA